MLGMTYFATNAYSNAVRTIAPLAMPPGVTPD